MISKIDQLLGSKTRTKVLSELILNSDRSYYMRELEKELKLNFSSIYKELTTLKNLGLVTDEYKGKTRLFKINKRSPIYSEVRGLILKTVGIGDVIRDALKDIGKVRFALVFGSIARGEEKETSDIGLLLIGDIDEEKLVTGIKDAEKSVGREINYIIWSEKEFNKRVKGKMGLLAEMEKNPIIMVLGDESEFREIVKGRRNPESHARRKTGSAGI